MPCGSPRRSLEAADHREDLAKKTPSVPGRPTLAIENSMNSARIDRHAVDQAAVERDLPRVHPVYDHPDAEEERAGDDASGKSSGRWRPGLPAWLKPNIPSVTKPMCADR